VIVVDEVVLERVLSANHFTIDPYSSRTTFWAVL
jgi:hypothetical protein